VSVSVRTAATSLAVLAIMGLLAYGLLKKGASELPLGKPVPGASVSLPALTGDGSGSVADYRGRWILMNVWASWCPPCRSESPALERFYEAHRGREFTVLGIDTGDASYDGIRFVRNHGITYPQLRDGPGTFAQQQLHTTGVPETFLVDPKGRLVLHNLGPVDARYLKANVAPYLNGKAAQ
jgi:cytochrome c biogenesis protein CcmG/thiol:disulfide interchange protein DsbE